MTSSTRKTLAGILSLAMVLTLVVGFSVAPASAQTTAMTTTTTTTTTAPSYTYTRDLTVGSTGADVTALQSMLYAKGYLSVAPTGYFGSLTKAALASWQAAVGISPASGYFGPITRAYISSMAMTSTGSTSMVAGCTSTMGYSSTTGASCAGSMTSTVAGCTAGAMFSSTTGQACTTTTVSTVPGCVTGAMYSSTTGASCMASGATMSSNGQGTLNVTQAASPITSTNITTTTDTPVYGLQIQAQSGDVTVQSLNLDVSVVRQGQSTVSDNPGSFINNVKVWDGSNVLLNMPVSISNFVTGTTSTDYHILLSGFNFVVPAGTTKNLVVSFSTSGSIDTNRVVTVRGYGGTSLQAISGNNIVSYYDISGISLSNTFTNSSTSTILSLGTAAQPTNPQTGTVYVNTSSGAQNVPLLGFTVQSSSGNATITEINATATSTGTAPSSLTLYNGSTALASESVGSSTVANVTFNNLSIPVTSGQSLTLTIQGNFPNNTAAGNVASTSVTAVYYQTANGSTNVTNTLVTGNNQTFYAASPNLSFVSGSVTAINSNNSNSASTTGLQGNLTFTVTPQPGQMLRPIPSDFVACFATSPSSGNCTQASSVALSFSPDPGVGNALPAGTATTINLSATVNSSQLQNAGTGLRQYYFFLASASTTVNNINGIPTHVTLGTSTLSNFYSQTPAVVNY